MELWQRFTHRARRAILVAHDEACQMRQRLIGTDHLLLGLLRPGEGLAADILREMGMDLGSLRDEVMAGAQSGGERECSNEIAFTPEAQRVLQIAYGESMELEANHIGTEHILLGLAREAGGSAAHVLSSHGVDAGRVRDIIALMDPDRRRVTEASGAERVPVAARELVHMARAATREMRRRLDEVEGLLVNIGGLIRPEQQEGSSQMNKQILSSDRIPPAVGPYSQAVRAGDMIFCSGVLGLDPETKELVQDTFEAEVRRVMDNLSMLLEDCGIDLASVVKTTVFLADMGQFSVFNGIYAEYFDDDPPARSTIQVAALPLGAQIEVEAIAIA